MDDKERIRILAEALGKIFSLAHKYIECIVDENHKLREECPKCIAEKAILKAGVK